MADASRYFKKVGGRFTRRDPDAAMLPHKLPPKYYEAIGEVVAAWAHLEFNVERLIWALLGLKVTEGRLLTTGMQARPKFQLLSKIASRYARTKDIEDAVINLCKRAEPLATLRNDVAHGVWVHPRGKRRLLHLHKVVGSVENRIEPKKIRYTHRKLAKQAQLMRKLAFDARWIIIGFHLTLPTSRKQS